MEGFPVDVQRIILEKICYFTPPNHIIGQLFPLLYVNKMFQKWTIRYALERVDKKELLHEIIVFWNGTDHVYGPVKWNVFEELKTQWTSLRLVSFIIYVDVRRLEPWFIKHPEKAEELFFKDGILYDLRQRIIHNRELRCTKESLKRYREEMRELQFDINDAEMEKEQEEKAIEALDKKWKRE